MKVIIKRPGEAAKVVVVGDVEELGDFIGGCFESVPLLTADGSRYVIVCNDNFLNDGSKFNMWLSGVMIFGNIFICKIEVVNELGEMDFVGLEDGDIANISDNLCWSDRDRDSLISWFLANAYSF